MHSFLGTLYNAAVARFGAGDPPAAALYLWTMARLGGDAVPKDLTRAFLSRLGAEIEQAVAAKAVDRARRLDSLGAMIDASLAARVGSDHRERLAARSAGDAADALSAGGLEAALSFSLAALAFDSSLLSARDHLTQATEILVARCEALDPGAPSLEGTLSLAVATALGERTPRRLLLNLLEKLGDFESAALLCEPSEADESAILDDRLETMKWRRFAQHRRDGVEKEPALARAVAEVCGSLVALGPPSALDDEALSTRIVRCYAHGGYRSTLADLREVRRRDPKNSWAAYNLCAILSNASHPDVVEAIDLLVEHVGEDPAALKTAYDLTSMIGATPQTLALAARLAPREPQYALVDLLHRMATDLDAPPAHVFGRAPRGRPLLYANLVCWGGDYIALMEMASIASLLAPGNIPSLVETVDLVIELFTTPDDLPRLLASEPLRRLATLCEIRLRCFSQAIVDLKGDWGYEIYGFALHATALRAERDGADLTFLLPDLIYADGGFARIARDVTRAPRALFTDGLNAQATPMLAAMAPYRRDGVLAVPSQALIEAMIRHPTKRTLHSLYQPGDRSTCASPTRVIFPLATGLRTHGFMMLPIYVSHAALAPIRVMNFRTQDGLFLEHVLNKVSDDQLTVLSGSEFCYAEIKDGDGLVHPMVEMSLRDAVRKFFVSYGLGRHRIRLFERPIEYPTQTPPGFPLASEQEAAARVQDVAALFATDPLMIDIAEEQERARRIVYR